jgi:3-isopropylmalate/(R)-2-methylmalate dehydratase large subunit
MRTLIDKIWDNHVIRDGTPTTPAILYIDLHLVHEVTSPQAFTSLRQRGLRVRRPDRTLATMDHSTPTLPPSMSSMDADSAKQLAALERNCADFDVPLYAMGSDRQGIVHVIGPELGLTQPGMTIVCGDSHTSTHGAFGALAFGIGTSEVEHVLATQCVLQSKPNTMEIRIEGRLQPGVTAKDIILALLAAHGVDAGTSHAFEYTGSAIRALSMEERMTICNMSIEAGARAGLIAPDDTTFAYVAGRPHAPTGQAWDTALTAWRQLTTDDDATYDRSLSLDASRVSPMITYGTNPGMGMPVDAIIPEPRSSAERHALDYMGLTAGQPLLGTHVDVVFLGSCTNSRISDLRLAASVLRGRRVSSNVRMLVVPGSQQVKRQAEAEGLADVFRHAGAEWREAGCSMCIAMNGDALRPGQYAVSTSNRNFEGRQGPGGRTFLASPLTAAATAIAGAIADVRRLQS